MLQRILVSALITILCATRAASAAPPFHGTIFIDPDIVTQSDPSAFESIKASGSDTRRMFDRRADRFITTEAHLFTAKYKDGLSIEIQVNAEFDAQEAEAQARKFAPVIGQLPHVLRRHVQTAWIHRGKKPFGGGNNNLLIHTEQAIEYEQQGILEETLIHEAAHTSLDAEHATHRDWQAAQKADDAFISDYARDNPKREDVAESFLPYFAVRYAKDRISQELHDTIVETIPNRLRYFDQQSFRMSPADVR